MAFKLAVDDRVGVKIKGATRGKDGREKEFAFVLVCDRMGHEEMKSLASDGQAILKFFEDHAIDWQGQTLVVDDQDKPAPFSVEALRVLMSMYGMPSLVWHSYVQQAAANGKN